VVCVLWSVAAATDSDTILNMRQRKTIDEAVQASSTLKLVLEFKQQLSALMQPSVQDTARLARLQEWCAAAEATGIEALHEFARQFRYSDPLLKPTRSRTESAVAP